MKSYLFEGAQKICPEMIHGKSITDPCLGWEDTEKLLYSIAEKKRKGSCKMKLYVTRHGETHHERCAPRLRTHECRPHRKRHRRQKEAGRSLQDKGIKRIIASPLLRAQHTARLIADEIGVDTIETEQRLIEQNYGIYENTDWDGEAFNANKREFAVRYPRRRIHAGLSRSALPL